MKCSIQFLCGWFTLQKPGCCVLNNSLFKRETLRDISHDNNEFANSCITAQHFTPSNLTIHPCLTNFCPCSRALN